MECIGTDGTQMNWKKHWNWWNANEQREYWNDCTGNVCERCETRRMRNVLKCTDGMPCERERKGAVELLNAKRSVWCVYVCVRHTNTQSIVTGRCKWLLTSKSTHIRSELRSESINKLITTSELTKYDRLTTEKYWLVLTSKLQELQANFQSFWIKKKSSK